MPVPRADLHTHTTYSDGRLRPEALVEKARRRGLAALAVTDHDTVAGVEEAMAAGVRHGIDVVPGVELSVTVDAREIHLLGYGFDPANAALRAHLRAFAQARRERAARTVERLHELGISLSFDAVLAQATGSEALGRPHVARALVEAGHVPSMSVAFERYLKDGGPAFVAKPRVPVEEALALLHGAGGIGVLAHPGHHTNDVLLRRLVRAGLDGLEVYHPMHDASLVRFYQRCARAFDLVETGGSDYHGQRARDEEHLGVYGVPLDSILDLRF